MDSHKILKLIAGANSQKQIKLLIQVLKEKGIKVPDEYIRTLLNKYHMLPKKESDSAI
jgi:hypothetical protein